jgi:hypothetical protein
LGLLFHAVPGGFVWQEYNVSAESSGRKVTRHRQRTSLVGFQGNLLGEHNVAGDETILRHEAPAHFRQASVV